MKIRFLLVSIFFVTMNSIVYASSNPNMSRVYGDQFASEFMQTQSAALIGTIDTTLGSSGYVSPASGSIAYAVQPLPDTTFVILSSNGSNSYLTKYNSEGTLITSGFGTAGVVTLTGLINPAAYILVDAQDRLLIAGYDNGSSQPWISRILPTGVVDTNFTFSAGAAWTTSGQINQLGVQTDGRIIAVGFNGTNAMVARYNLNGTIDDNVTNGFGPTHSGYAILNGSNSLPTSTVSLYSVVVDTANNIYIAYVNSTPSVYVMRLTSAGIVDTTWNSGSPLNLSYLNPSSGSMVTSQLRMIIDSIGNLVVAVPSGTVSVIKAASIATSTGTVTPTTPGTFVNVTMTTGVFGSDAYALYNMMASSNGSVYFVGSDTTSKQMMVVRYTSAGVLDTAFNSTGVNFFNTVSSPSVNAILYAGSIALTGEIYVAGSQSDGGGPTVTPYVSRLYNTQYITQVAQSPATTQEQGILDLTFGAGYASETYAGVTSVINGIYGSALKQQAVAAIEVRSGTVTQGDILVGLNGLTNNPYHYSGYAGSENSLSNMMFGYLTQSGEIDYTAGYSGYLTLQNLTNSNEYMTSMLEDGAGNVYVSGYTSATYGGTSNAAIMRIYSVVTAGNAAIAISEAGTGWKGIGVSLQNKRSLLCVAESSTVGHISSYISGNLDLTFGAGGTGYIQSTSYSLAMGPCYGLVVNSDENIFAAYVKNGTSQVDLVKFLPDGSNVDTTFGTSGVIPNIFTAGTYPVDPSNVRIGLMASGDIIVAATSGTNLLVATFSPASLGTTTPTMILTASITGTTALNLTRVTGVSGDMIMFTFWDNAADDTMYLARVFGSSLDASFNSQGSAETSYQQGVLAIKIGDKVADYNARVATCSLVQSTAGASMGSIVVVGYESVTTNDSAPMAMRVYGDYGTTEVLDYQLNAAIPGTLDTAYDLTTSPAIAKGFGKAIFVYPAGNVHAGKILIGMEAQLSQFADVSIVARLDQSTMTLDPTFGDAFSHIPGVCVMVTPNYSDVQRGINSLNIDANNKILVGGVNGTGWAILLDDNGASQQWFDSTAFTNITAIHGIYQQKSGRYIIAASGTDTTLTSVGIVLAFQDHLVPGHSYFQLDHTFNPLAINNVAAGSYSLGATAGLYSLAINTNDTIVAAYANTASPGKIVVNSITADGSGQNLNFNSGSQITTGISADSSSVVQVNIDSSGNVVVGASYNSGGTHQVQVQRFDSAGGTTTQFTGSGVSAGVQTIANLGTAGVTLTGLMETITGQTVLTGYNTAGGHGNLFASRLTSTGALDSSWNSVATSPDTPGVLTYEVFSAININNAAIGNDGTILSIGSTSATLGSSSPIVSLVYGDNLVTQVAQNPLQSSAGTVDLTIAGSTAGALPLASLPVAPSLTGVPAKIYIYNSTVSNPSPNSSPNGAMLVASISGASVYLTQLNSDLSLNTANFGTAGVVTITPNTTTSPLSATITDMYVANGTNEVAGGTIYLGGYTTNGSAVNTPFVAQIASNGSSSVVSSAVAGLTTTGCVRQSSNSRILLSGYNGSSGAIVAYNSALNAIDTSFGNNSGTGYYTTGTATAIVAMTTDNSDRIYIAYQTSSSQVKVQRLLENGTALDTSFGSSGTYTISGTNLSATQIKMSVDFVNYQLVVAIQSGTGTSNSIQVQRLYIPANTSGGSSSGSLTTVVAAGAVFNLADLFIDNVQNIYVAGYLASGTGAGNSVVVRLNSSVALDTTYGTSGIANQTVGAMSVVTAAALHPDRRVYLVGSNGSTTGYMGRFFGDYYWTQDSQAIQQGLVGTLDTTLPPSYNGTMNFQNVPNWFYLVSSYKACAIIENPNGDGTAFIAFGDNTNLMIGKVDADLNPVTTFGSSYGLTTPVAMATVNSIIIDAVGNICVAGTNGLLSLIIFPPSGATPTVTTITNPGTFTSGTTVAQQKSGRYIVAGQSGSMGTLTAYKNISAVSGTTLPYDPTFGLGSSNSYYFIVGTTFDDIVIDDQDYIYIAYRNTSDGHLFLSKITAEGSAPVSAVNSPVAFNGGSDIDTGIVATQAACIAINQAGNILVGAATSAGVQVRLYDKNGTPLYDAVTVLSGNTPILTQLVGSVGSQNEFYGSAYNTSSQAIIFAVKADGTLDTTGFNSASTPGYIATSNQSPRQMNGISIQYDGKIVAVGYTDTYPILVRAYGYPYVSQYAQDQYQAAAGLLDTTLWPTVGALELDTYTPISGIVGNLAGSRVKRIYEYSTGKALFVLDNTGLSNDSTTIIRVNKDLTLDTTFNANGYVTIAGKTNTSSLFINTDGSIYVAGGTTTSWIRAFNSNGTAKTGWVTPTSNLSAGAYQVAVQSNQRVILAGQNSNGTLYGYTSTGVLDSSFGVNGSVDNGFSHPITDITIDAYNNIFTVVNNNGSVVLQKILFTGLGTPLTSSGTQITTAVSGSNIKVLLDASGRIVVAAATATGFALRSYNNDATLSLNATIATVTAGTTPVLANIYATSDGKITLIGYDSATTGPTAGQIIVARCISASGGITLDTTTFNPSAGYLVTAIGSLNVAYDGFICADDRIMIGGTNSTSAEPYLGRVFGDTYVSYVTQAPTEGLTGTLNTTFGNTNPPTGKYEMSSLTGLLTGAKGQAILPTGNGSYYAAFDNANSAANSILIKTLADGSLDTSYNFTGIATSYAPLGITGMMLDTFNNMVLAGTALGAGWLQRYTSSGVADSSFGTSGLVTMASGTSANVVVEQTSARLVVAGSNAAGKGALFAYTAINPSQASAGAIDTTFNAGSGGTPGTLAITTTSVIPSLIADQYDRLIFAVLNGSNVDLYRLTATGEMDLTFGASNGIVASAISGAAGASNIRVAFDASGNIVVAATSSTSNTFSVRAFTNGTLTTLGGNGAQVYSQLNTSSLVSPLVTGLVTTADGYTLVLGNQSGTNASWIARITSGGILDTTFNAAGLDGQGNTGGIAGIFQYSAGGGTTAHVYNGLAVNQNGTLGMIGYENSSGTFTPTIVGVYDSPFTAQDLVQYPGSKAVGTNDATFGVSTTAATNNGITFYGSGSLASYGQVAQALALYNDNNIVVAIDGGNETSSNSSIFINMFDNDGLLYNQSPAFGTAGRATVLQGATPPSSPNYQNQYVRDMITFTTGGVTKAILAGYVYNSTLGTNSSLILQYILTPGSNGIDSSPGVFGGFNGNPYGIAFGDAQKAFVVGQQSTGRIVVGGLSKNNVGLLLGYTSAGKLDTSFGNDGYQSVNTGSTGIYTHAIDNQNRVVIAYNNGGYVVVSRFLSDGSALDSSFNASASYISGVVSDSNIKVAVDSSNNVYVAAITNDGTGSTGNAIVMTIYSHTNGNQTVTNTFDATVLGATTASNYTLGRLIVDAQANGIVVASDSVTHQTVVVRVVPALTLDPLFNGTGYINYTVAGATVSQVTTDALIHPDGRIIVVGSEA